MMIAGSKVAKTNVNYLRYIKIANMRYNVRPIKYYNHWINMKLLCCCMILITVKCRPHRYHVNLTTRLTHTEQRLVHGVTTLNNKIFVVYWELPFIVVYMSQQPYTRLPNISINGLKRPTDIAASSKCVYVSDWGSVAIWRVKAADSKVDQWLCLLYTSDAADE